MNSLVDRQENDPFVPKLKVEPTDIWVEQTDLPNPYDLTEFLTITAVDQQGHDLTDAVLLNLRDIDYQTVGDYPVTVSVTDSVANMSFAQLTVHVVPPEESDDDNTAQVDPNQENEYDETNKERLDKKTEVVANGDQPVTQATAKRHQHKKQRLGEHQTWLTKLKTRRRLRKEEKQQRKLANQKEARPARPVAQVWAEEDRAWTEYKNQLSLKEAERQVEKEEQRRKKAAKKRKRQAQQKVDGSSATTRSAGREKVEPVVAPSSTEPKAASAKLSKQTVSKKQKGRPDNRGKKNYPEERRLKRLFKAVVITIIILLFLAIYLLLTGS